MLAVMPRLHHHQSGSMNPLFFGDFKHLGLEEYQDVMHELMLSDRATYNALIAEHPAGGLDALTVLTVVGQSVRTMELGTAVIPTYPRHPMVLAGQALTAQSAMDGAL
ncbi:LLM class flavin-dependent oxidoreductase, partial [Acidimicrobiales bacterium]|nr:LLM class flavin-dependent oxidoreductase [Acidimicrobiales bacterium]